MIPPTSIDGTDITGATIDGTDVQEITVDGDVVFSAEQLPVAYSNLVAWYPARNSGADATAGDTNSGDSTDYGGTLGSGASIVSGGGVTDLDTGANSDAFDFDGSNDAEVVTNTGGVNLFGADDEGCFTFWVKDDGGGNPHPFGNFDDDDFIYYDLEDGDFSINGSSGMASLSGPTLGLNWYFIVLNYGSTVEYYSTEEGESSINLRDTDSNVGSVFLDNDIYFGDIGPSSNLPLDGKMDDIRIYNRSLSQSELQGIFDNTTP